MYGKGTIQQEEPELNIWDDKRDNNINQLQDISEKDRWMFNDI